MTKQTNKIALIQIIASLLIVNHHTGGLEIPYLNLLTKGGFVVNIIFVYLSGYLLSISTIKNKELDSKEFFFKRIQRIYPSLHISILFTIILYLFICKEIKLYPLLLTISGFQYLFDINYFGVQLWFISLILICYILFIPTINVICKNPILYFISLLIGFLLIVTIRGDLFNDIYYKINEDIVYRIYYHYLIFVLGIIAYIKLERIEIFKLPTAIILILIGLLIYIIIRYDMRLGVITSVLAVLVALSIITIISSMHFYIINKIPFVFFLSGITYEIYLIHVALIDVIKILLPKKIIGYFLVYFFTICLAFLISKISIIYKEKINVFVSKTRELYEQKSQ